MTLKDLKSVSANKIFVRWTDSDGQVRHKLFEGRGKYDREICLIEARRMNEYGNVLVVEVDRD